MRKATFLLTSILFLIACFSIRVHADTITIRSASGPDPASIQGTVNQFRTDLGDPNTGNNPGPLPGGRREINWDGGGSATTVSGTPFTGFQVIRGAIFNTPGAGFVQAPPSGLATTFANPTYSTIFQPFSNLRVFAVIGNNVMDVTFSVPGSPNSPALTSGFGAVFTDVDLANTTSLEFFDINDVSLGNFFVPTANNGLSFLGGSFASPLIARVHIVLGNSMLGPNDGGGTDVVAMDDFIYGEPTNVPEPATLLLLGSGLTCLVGRARRMRRVVK